MLALCALALSIAVVAWGAEYKVEQYPLKGLAFRVMSPAKLLTEKERPPRSGVSRANTVEPTTQNPLMLLAGFFAPALQYRGIRCRIGECLRPGECMQAKNNAAWTYFGIRPPPACAIA